MLQADVWYTVKYWEWSDFIMLLSLLSIVIMVLGNASGASTSNTKSSHPQDPDNDGVEGDTKKRKIGANETSDLADKNDAKFDCRFCKQTFPKSQALGGHMNRHRQEREHEEIEKAQHLIFNSSQCPSLHLYSFLHGTSTSTGDLQSYSRVPPVPYLTNQTVTSMQTWPQNLLASQLNAQACPGGSSLLNTLENTRTFQGSSSERELLSGQLHLQTPGESSGQVSSQMLAETDSLVQSHFPGWSNHDMEQDVFQNQTESTQNMLLLSSNGQQIQSFMQCAGGHVELDQSGNLPLMHMHVQPEYDQLYGTLNELQVHGNYQIQQDFEGSFEQKPAAVTYLRKDKVTNSTSSSEMFSMSGLEQDPDLHTNERSIFETTLLESGEGLDAHDEGSLDTVIHNKSRLLQNRKPT